MSRKENEFSDKIKRLAGRSVGFRCCFPGCNRLLISKKENSDEYACWSTFNESIKSMNSGHYNLATEEDAFEILKDYFFDITDDMAHYGPQKSMTEIDNDFTVKVEEGNEIETIQYLKQHPEMLPSNQGELAETIEVENRNYTYLKKISNHFFQF